MLLMLRVEVGRSRDRATADAAFETVLDVAVDVVVDVVVDVDPDHVVDDVARSIADHVGAPPGPLVVRRTGRRLRPSDPVADADLVSGDTVRLAAVDARHRPARVPERAVVVAVTSGAETGESTLIHRGRSTIGRGAGCEVVIDDPMVSRRHLTVVIADDWSVVVGACEPRGGGAAPVVTVNGCEIDGPIVVSADDVIGLGASRIVLRRYTRARRRGAAAHDHLGQVEFLRTPYRLPVVPERGTETIGPIPVRRDTRRIQLFTALAPLAAGLVLYAFSSQLQYLALTLVSPVMMFASAAGDRRTGRRASRVDVAEFRDLLVRRRTDLLAIRSAERVERLGAAPDLADLVLRAERRSIDLWPRGRSAPDFLRVRLGLGTLPTRFEVALERGGDERLREEATAVIDGLDRVDGVPVTVDLVQCGVVGVHGDPAAVDGMVASLVVQAACLHSPDDLTLVAALGAGRSAGWLKWLPHVRSITSPVAGPHVARGRIAGDRLVAAVLDVVAHRLGDDRAARGARDQHPWPRILFVLDAASRTDRAAVARLLDLGPAAGVAMVWLGASDAEMPHQATAVLALAGSGADRVGPRTGRLWCTDPGIGAIDVEVELLGARVASRAARSLAPVRDASTASSGTSIPRSVDLLDVLDPGATCAASIGEGWLRHAAYGLRVPIGQGSGGLVEVDLVHDGPHALIGGTSGAGKSELLQSFVVGLAVRYAPQRLHLLFVDYKGGASSQALLRLPHTVGSVTNLSTDLARRALISLRAELDRRMALLAGRAKDLDEMLRVAPDAAPSSLVIVIDEFATLVKEIPEFVAGIVDIAQRGRSLGIHLVLATQRPSGAVDENILANTNLRISLRMLERGESTAVIGTPDAAAIPVPLRGRAFARLGARQLLAFQAAHAGAPMIAASGRRPVRIAAFVEAHSTPRQAASTGEGAVAGDSRTPTQLDAVIDAVVEANRELGLPLPRGPWCDPLPEVLALADVLGDVRIEPARLHPGRVLAVAMLDAPERQEQRPLLVDLEQGGGWLVVGCGGSGKSTLLRSVAASIAALADPADVGILAFDFASRGLDALRRVPHVIDVATGDDLEAVTRHIVALDHEVHRRRAVLAAASAEHLTAYNERHAPITRIVVLVDGFGGLLEALSEVAPWMVAGGEGWADRMMRIVVDGRQVGIHAVLTADRRSAVPTRLQAAIANRLVLRQAEHTAYGEHGVVASVAAALDLVPGRGLWQARTMVQVATVARDPAAHRQCEAIARLAAEIDVAPTAALRSHRLPETVELATVDLAASLSPLASHALPIGVVDVSGEPAVLDLGWSDALVAGAPRSGRSTALATIAAALAGHRDVICVGPRSSGLAAATFAHSVFDRTEAIAQALDRLTAALASGVAMRPVAIVVDDLDAIDDRMLAGRWDRLLALESVRFVAAVETRSLSGFTADPLLLHLKRSRRLLVLQPDDPAEFVQATGVRLAQRPGVASVAGRGVLLADRVAQIVQIAVPPDHRSREAIARAHVASPA